MSMKRRDYFDAHLEYGLPAGQRKDIEWLLESYDKAIAVHRENANEHCRGGRSSESLRSRNLLKELGEIDD